MSALGVWPCAQLIALRIAAACGYNRRVYQDHFSSVSRQYAAFRPRYPAALFQYLASIAPRRERAWDCACGSGQASRDLARHFKSVIATDASRAQIEEAVPHVRVDYRVATAEDSGVDSGSTDLISVAQAAHWFDLDRFYAEVRRVAAPRAVVALWSYGMMTLDHQETNDRIQEFYAVTLDGYWPAERKLVEDGYRALAFPFAELTPPPFAMEVEWSLPELLGYVQSWSATQRFAEKNGVDPTMALADAITTGWGDTHARRGISWPLALRVGIVTDTTRPE